MTRHHDIDDELRFHVESRVRELIAQGLSAADAERQAAGEFGDRQSVRAECADIRRSAGQRRRRRDFWNGWLIDLRHGVRAIIASPLYSIAAISILTLGIGLSSTVFAALHGIFLNPLPYPDSRQLHRLYATNAAKNDIESPMSPGDFFALREALAPEATFGGYMNWPVSLTGVAEPERLNGALASADLFGTLGVGAAAGRTFTFDDEAPSSSVALVSARLAARLGLFERVVGSTLELNGQPTVIIGMMPAGFEFPAADIDVWVPLSLRPADRDNHAARWLHTIVRIPRGGGPAMEKVDAAMAGLAADFPASNAGWGARTVPLLTTIVGPAGVTLAFLALAIACALAVMIVNLIALVTSRVHRRSLALAIQQALGADRWRLLRQLGIECGMIALAGGALGLLLTSGLVGGFQRLAGHSVPRASEVTISPSIAAFAVTVAALALGAMTIVPLWRTIAAAASPLRGLATRGVATGAPSRALVVVQSAMACLLLVAAALLTQTYQRLLDVDPGFNPDSVLTMTLSLPRQTPPAQQASFFATVVDRVAQLPGVIAAGAASDLPMSGNSLNVPIVVDRTAMTTAPGDPLRAGYRVVTPGYLEAIAAQVRGRAFERSDVAGRPPVAMVNETFARMHWPARDALGMRVRTSEDTEWRTVVGVVGDVRDVGPSGDEGAVIYVPHAQKSEAFMTWMSVAVRTAADPLASAPAVRATLAGIDRNQPVSNVRSLNDLAGAAVALPRLAATVAAWAAAGTLALAMLGIGAVLSLLASARSRDYAVRLALGAPPTRLRWSPVIECVSLVTGGGLAGLLAAAVIARLMKSLLFGVSPVDGATYAISLAALVAIAVLTAIGPARAIARIDPTLTLRS